MKGKSILVTGGAGYIGSHTIVELVQAGFTKIYSIDSYINSDPSNYELIENICGLKPNIIELDLNNHDIVIQFFEQSKIDAVIHFAALKSVPDSVANPNLYYQNNLNGLINVLDGIKLTGVKNFIFSSSCSVYGNPEKLPVTENTPFGEAESPYARSKQMGENIIHDFIKANPTLNAISLRYFNPVGAHPTALIGEGYSKKPDNIVPVITQATAGLREKVIVFGDDYSTRDGSCIRDYIHVCDIAIAHVKALEHLQKSNSNTNYQVINLGSGIGTSVLELLQTFEKINNVKVPFKLGERRVGDVESIYANNNYAKEVLGWETKYSLEDMMETAWMWQKQLIASK